MYRYSCRVRYNKSLENDLDKQNLNKLENTTLKVTNTVLTFYMKYNLRRSQTFCL